MTNKELKLAGELLDKASDVYANYGCNDWEFPPDWTLEERRTFVKEYHDYNGSPDDYDPDDLWLGDFQVMAFLAHKLINP